MTIRMISRTPRSRFIISMSAAGMIFIGINFIGIHGSLFAEEVLTPTDLSNVSRRLMESRREVERTSDILPRVRRATWQLLVGEMAGDTSFGLSSRSLDELSHGLKDLDQLALELKENPDLERKLTKQLQLAMRFDATQARRSAIEKQREISRKDELERLSQLREINRSYRELVRNLMRLQTSQILGEPDQIAKIGDDSVKLIADVEQVVRRRRDFYLFQDEPELTSDLNSELNLVRELAEPMSKDVRRHQLAIQAYSLTRLALPFSAASREQLETARRLAEASLEDSNEPHVLGHWALAIACREIGRLETIEKPWDRDAHQRALPWFERARKNLDAAKSQGSTRGDDLSWAKEIERQSAELNSPDSTLQTALTMLGEGHAQEAAVLVDRCATLHRSTGVAIALSDCRRLAGATLEELDQLVGQYCSSGLFVDEDMLARLVRGRQGILGIWQQLSEARQAVREDWRPALAARLKAALADLDFALTSESASTRRIARAHKSLGAVIYLLIVPENNPEMARADLLAVPMAISEMEQDLNQMSAFEKPIYRESIIAGRLAQGYLAIRLLADYRDVGPKAFAIAVETRAMVPAGLTMPQVLGGPVLKSLLARADGYDTRLAREEQLVRRSLQRALPAIAAMQFGPSTDTAANLLATARGLESSKSTFPTDDMLDPRDTTDARTMAGAEIRTAAILGFLAAHEPAEALRECLVSFNTEFTLSALRSVDIKSMRELLIAESDPVRKSVVALAIEEFTVNSVSSASEVSRDLLALSLELQQMARKNFDDSSVLKKWHPAEIEMNRQALRRLTEPEFYLSQSRALISDLRMSDARRSLTDGSRRHPDSTEIREALIQTLIDEADLRPDRSTELITSAIEQLEILTATPTHDISDSLLKLAGLYERKPETEERARTIYRQICQQASDQRHRILARSRLTVLQVRVASP